jgi:hypothetical protein
MYTLCQGLPNFLHIKAVYEQFADFFLICKMVFANILLMSYTDVSKELLVAYDLNFGHIWYVHWRTGKQLYRSMQIFAKAEGRQMMMFIHFTTKESAPGDSNMPVIQLLANVFYYILWVSRHWCKNSVCNSASIHVWQHFRKFPSEVWHLVV